MSTKLAIIDIDGVVADASARFAKAGEAKQAYLNEMAELQISDERGATDAYWEAALNPEHVYLDTLMASANAALNGLLQSGYHIVFLTSNWTPLKNAGPQSYPLEWYTSLQAAVEAMQEEGHALP